MPFNQRITDLPLQKGESAPPSPLSQSTARNHHLRREPSWSGTVAHFTSSSQMSVCDCKSSNFRPLFVPWWVLEKSQGAMGWGGVLGIEKAVVQDKLHHLIHPSSRPALSDSVNIY